MHPLWPSRRQWSRCACLPLGFLLPASGDSVACENVKCLDSVSFSPGSLLAWKATGIYPHGQLARGALCCVCCANGYGNCPAAQRFSRTAALPLLTCCFSRRKLSSWHTLICYSISLPTKKKLSSLATSWKPGSRPSVSTKSFSTNSTAQLLVTARSPPLNKSRLNLQ